MKRRKISLIVLALGILFVFAPDLQRILNLNYFKENQERFISLYQQNQALTLVLFFATYSLLTAISFPGATVLTLIGGALFGNAIGIPLISVAATCGATMAFLSARYFFRASINAEFATRTESLRKGFEKNGAYYLFLLRLNPIVPFFLINLGMGLTNLSTWSFFWVSLIGMLPGTFVFVNAGTQLSTIRTTSDVWSADIVIAFLLLGLFPLLAKKLATYFTSTSS